MNRRKRERLKHFNVIAVIIGGGELRKTVRASNEKEVEEIIGRQIRKMGFIMGECLISPLKNSKQLPLFPINNKEGEK